MVLSIVGDPPKSGRGICQREHRERDDCSWTPRRIAPALELLQGWCHAAMSCLVSRRGMRMPAPSDLESAAHG